MELSAATPQQIAEELTTREIDFILIVNEGKIHIYSPEKIRGRSDQKAAGLFSMVRDFINFMEERGLT